MFHKYDGLKVGMIARTILRQLLESGKVPDEKVRLLLEDDKDSEGKKIDYSKTHFDIQYPLLKATTGTESRPKHYYGDTVCIRNKHYFMCCEWHESADNNDRDPLIRWIENTEAAYEKSQRHQ